MKVAFPESKDSLVSDLKNLMSDKYLLSNHSIRKLIERKVLQIEPFDDTQVSPTSIDLRLGSVLVKYSPQTIRIGGNKPQSYEINISQSSYKLAPGEFVLGMTKEKVYIPNGYQGVIETKGNIARAGLSVHNNDGHIDPGFHGHITLEIVNMHNTDVYIDLIQETFICQLFIGTLSEACDTTYHGKYLNQEKPTVYQP